MLCCELQRRSSPCSARATRARPSSPELVARQPLDDAHRAGRRGHISLAVEQLVDRGHDPCLRVRIGSHVDLLKRPLGARDSLLEVFARDEYPEPTRSRLHAVGHHRAGEDARGWLTTRSRPGTAGSTVPARSDPELVTV